jgi:DNA primase catalytic core
MEFNVSELSNIPILNVAQKLGISFVKNKTKCFLHEEKTASLSVNPSKNYWKCFGCNEGGNVINLVEKYYGITFVEACNWLSYEFGYSSKSFHILKAKIKSKKLETSVSINDEVDYELYKWIFDNSSISKSAVEYLENTRKYPTSVIKEFNIRSIDNSKDFFTKCTNKWGQNRLIKAGIAKEYINQRGEQFFGLIWWDNTLLFPFYDLHNEISYIQGRTITEKSDLRYINLSNINTVPFNLQVLNKLPKLSHVLITEGVTDCISCWVLGKPAIGIIGASGFKEEYINFFKDFIPVIIPDNDKAGNLFAARIKKLFERVGKELFVLPLDIKFKDISDYYINESSKHESHN